jgi:hypothetical protein
VAPIRRKKDRLTLIIDELDLKAESSPLSVVEWDAKKEAHVSLAKLRRDEETMWAQRVKVRNGK